MSRKHFRHQLKTLNIANKPQIKRVFSQFGHNKLDAQKRLSVVYKQPFQKTACGSICTVHLQTIRSLQVIKTSLLAPLISASRVECGEKTNTHHNTHTHTTIQKPPQITKGPLPQELRKLLLYLSFLQRVMIQTWSFRSINSYIRSSARSTSWGENLLVARQVIHIGHFQNERHPTDNADNDSGRSQHKTRWNHKLPPVSLGSHVLITSHASLSDKQVHLPAYSATALYKVYI